MEMEQLEMEMDSSGRDVQRMEEEEEDGGLRLHVLGHFKPFGATLIGPPPPTSGKEEDSDTIKRGECTYVLFDPELVLRSRIFDRPNLSPSTQNHDEEIFVHGNTVIWSAGHQVRKRFSAPSAVIQAVWCCFDTIREPVLCVLHSTCLATYTPSGETNVVPLPHSMVSIWPLPFGLLLQKGHTRSPAAFNPALINRGAATGFQLGGTGSNALSFHNISSQSIFCLTEPAFSYFVLQHPLEEPQVLHEEQAGQISAMADMGEQIIWTSSDVFYVASYHTVNMRHSVWAIKSARSKQEGTSHREYSDSFEDTNTICLQRVWQDEENQPVSDRVFLATDDDGMPIICFLLKPLQRLNAIRLTMHEYLGEKLAISWSIPAIAAAPVVATRPWLRHTLKQFDLIILAIDGTFSLYRGQYWLCKLIYPRSVDRVLNSLLDSYGIDKLGDLHPCVDRGDIIDLCDAVQDRVNVVTSSGQVIRCAICPPPASTLTVSCFMALDEGLSRPFYYNFLVSLFKHNQSKPTELVKTKCEAGGFPDLEWESFVNLLMAWCQKGGEWESDNNVGQRAAWEFLLTSSMHKINKKAYAHLTFQVLPEKYGTIYQPVSLKGVLQGSSEHLAMLTEMLIILHATYEDRKLDTLRWRDLEPLSFLLGNVAAALCQWNYVDYYARDFPNLFEIFQVSSQPLKVDMKTPFNIFQYLEGCLQGKNNSSHDNRLPSLYLVEGVMCVEFSRKVAAFYELLSHREPVTGILPSGVHVRITSGSSQMSEHKLVLAMVGEGFGLPDLDRLPVGVALPLRHALNSCREAPPSDWPESAFSLVGREDLAFMKSQGAKGTNAFVVTAPYMLHLRPVPVLSSSNDCSEGGGVESVSSDEGANDGMGHMFNATNQLRFGRDLRMNEVRRLLCSSRPVAVRMVNPPDVSDPDIVAQQQAQLWQLAQRTTSLSFGRGAFTLGTMQNRLTEVLPIPKLVLAGRLPSQHDATVNLDPSTGNFSELTSWPEFHNGVAAGLRLAPNQDKITRTWIAYNKPEEPSYAHAGVLMSLGLHGHLRVLAATDVYCYLSQEHEATTVGILLGMAAAHRGTMDPAISKILYLHIPARHPPSFPELELPTLMQSAALMAVGLLYQCSAHRLTTEILLGEIGRKPGSDNVLEREGYALAAGLALGLVTLGKGKSAWGLADLLIEERLLYYMSGGTEPAEGSQQRLDLSNSSSSANTSKDFEDLYQNNGQVMEGSMVNLDVTAPGATLALGLMFLKTNSEEVAARLTIPDTHFALEYVRPDFILLRVVARNLVLWDRVEATEEWVQSQVPLIVKEVLAASEKKKEGFDSSSGDVDVEALAQAHMNILAGACLSIGLRYAGTSSADAQQLLYRYALYFLKEKRSAAPLGGTSGSSNRYNYVDRGTLETCMNVAVLSLSVVMAGSGHLGTFKLLRYLRRRNDVDGAISYGNHMAVNMAIGFLFMGGGNLTFSTNNNAIAALLIALYPRFATAPNDHRCHLQAFRHLYVLATESRCIQTIDVDSGLPVYAPLEITLRGTHSHSETSFCQVSPCILPERSVIKRVRVCGPRYWPQDILLCPSDVSWWHPNDVENPFKKGLLFVKRKVGARSYGDDPTGCCSLLSHTLQNTLKEDRPATTNRGERKVDMIVSTFSADPSLLAFAHMFRISHDSNHRLGSEFEEFCMQALLECISSDKPALLQAYLSLYGLVESLIEIARGCTGTLSTLCSRSLSLCSLKLALVYSDTAMQLQGAPIVQQTFLAALASRVNDILNPHQVLPGSSHKTNTATFLVNDLQKYFRIFQNTHVNDKRTALDHPLLLACYLKWYNIPCPTSMAQLLHQQPSIPSILTSQSFSNLPLLALILPQASARTLIQISESMDCWLG